MRQSVRRLLVTKQAQWHSRQSSSYSYKLRSRGSVLAETMVSILIATTMATALIKMYCNIHHVGDAARGQVIASAIAQEVFDQLRALPYETVNANLGTHMAPVNGTAGTDVLFPRPLLMDTGNFDYTAGNPNGPVAAGAKNLFTTVDPISHVATNTVQVTITSVAQNGVTALVVNLVMCWLDGTGSYRNYSSWTVLTRNGLGS